MTQSKSERTIANIERRTDNYQDGLISAKEYLGFLIEILVLQHGEEEDERMAYLASFFAERIERKQTS